MKDNELEETQREVEEEIAARYTGRERWVEVSMDK